MEKTIPAAASMLLDFIGGIEAPHGYDTVYGNNQAKLPKPLTSMTIDEVIAAGSRWTKSFGSSAAGFLQFMRATLLRLKKKLGLSGKELLDARMQRLLGYELLKERGFEEFMAGTLSRTSFGLALAQEWASFPVLVATKRPKKSNLARGQSFYAGDGKNKALVAPARVEAMLDQVKAIGSHAPADPAAPEVQDTETAIDRDTIERVQKQLKDLGYTEVGEVDGKIGTMTGTAIRAFRAENGLPAGVGIDDALLLALQKAKPRVLAPARTDAAPDVVRDKVPEAKASWWTKVTTFFGSIGALLAAAFNGILGNVDSARSTIEPLMTLFADIPGWVWFSLFAAVLFGLFLISRHGEAKSIEAFQTGARR